MQCNRHRTWNDIQQMFSRYQPPCQFGYVKNKDETHSSQYLSTQIAYIHVTRQNFGPILFHSL